MRVSAKQTSLESSLSFSNSDQVDSEFLTSPSRFDDSTLEGQTPPEGVALLIHVETESHPTRSKT